MDNIDLAAKISGPETATAEELQLGFLEEIRFEISDGDLADVTPWDLIGFFVRYLNHHDYSIARKVTERPEELSPELKERAERFYSLDWRERTRKYPQRLPS